MVEIPTSRAIQRVGANSGRIANRGPSVSVGRAIEGAGRDLESAAKDLHRQEIEGLERVASVQARERDSELSEQIRTLLYDPQNGYATLGGQDAVTARPEVMKKIQMLRDDSIKGLSPAAAEKVRGSAYRRAESASLSIEKHALTSREDWMDGVTTARIETSFQDALSDFSQTNMALQNTEAELIDRANKKGWSQEQFDLELATSKSRIYAAQITHMASTSPTQAMEYLQSNRGDMLPSEVAKLEKALLPDVKRATGRALAQEAYAEKLQTRPHKTKIDFELGPSRPYSPKQPILDVIGRSVEDVLGKGARVVITSGQEGDQKQHGSNRHKTGHAADAKIFRPDGSIVKSTDPEMKAIALASAKNGALGIGFGSEYMGGQHLHIDLVEPGKGQASTWASGGVALRGDVDGIIKQRTESGGIRDLLGIEDPDVRDGAIAEAKLILSVESAEQKARQTALENQAFRHIESGGGVDDLPFEVRAALGREEMNGLRTYADNLKSGSPPKTNPVAYLELREMQANDPQAFKEVSLLSYVSKLSQADFKKFVDDQTKSASDVAGNAASTLMTTANRHLKAVFGNMNTTKNKKKTAEFQTGILRWQDNFIAEKGVKPTPFEIDQQVGRMLTEIVPDGWSWGNTSKGAFELEDGDVKISTASGEIDIPYRVVQEQIKILEDSGIEATRKAVMERLESLLADSGLF